MVDKRLSCGPVDKRVDEIESRNHPSPLLQPPRLANMTFFFGLGQDHFRLKHGLQSVHVTSLWVESAGCLIRRGYFVLSTARIFVWIAPGFLSTRVNIAEESVVKAPSATSAQC